MGAEPAAAFGRIRNGGFEVCSLDKQTFADTPTLATICIKSQSLGRDYVPPSSNNSVWALHRSSVSKPSVNQP